MRTYYTVRPTRVGEAQRAWDSFEGNYPTWAIKRLWCIEPGIWSADLVKTCGMTTTRQVRI
jgi:hypothetical protein